MQIFIATKNPGKIREFKQMLGDGHFEWDDLSRHPGLEAPEETGATFLENAMLKASYYAKALKEYAIADDSGLEVDVLERKPGVHSARWAKMHNQGEGDADNNRLLLSQLKNVPQSARAARFVCSLALSDPNGNILLTASDAVEGEIIDQPRGENGFGYDPLFYVASMGKTTAQLEANEKHAISHRGKALRKLQRLMQDAFRGERP